MKTDFPNFSTEITVRHLLTHASGVFDYYDEDIIEDFDNFHVSIPWNFLETPSDYIPLFQNEGMKFSPGEKFSYSNGGYILLGIIIENLTGMKFRDFIHEQIFTPCGMKDSGYFATNQLPERTAFGYMEKKDGSWQTNIFNVPRYGASDGGAYTSIRDIKIMWRAFISNNILSDGLTNQFKTNQIEINSSKDIFYGYGMYIIGKEKDPLLGLMGEDAGVGFNTKYVESKDRIMTIISNTTSGEVSLYKEILPFLKK